MRAAIGACVLVGLLLGVAGAAPRFRIVHQRDPDEATSIVVSGTVFNEENRDVVEVWVTAEALGASGKVLATGLAFVSSSIPSRRSASFRAKLPRVDGVQSFRLSVSAFRYGATAESP